MSQTETNGTITAYPLAWPPGWGRTRHPSIARYGDRSLAAARDELIREARLFGGQKLIISSNLVLKLDGLPKSGQRQPDDKGVAVYFEYKNKPVSFACDKWNSVEDNVWAIVLTLSAMRQIARSGSSELLDRAFRGFDALPAPAGSGWWEVLEISPTASLEEIKSAYRTQVKLHHPDAGGDQFERIQAAYEAGIASR